MNLVPSRGRKMAGLFLHLFIASLAFMIPYTYLGGLRLLASDWLAVCALFYWLFVLASERRLPRMDPLYMPMAAYFGFILLSAVFSSEPFAHFLPRLAAAGYLLGICVVTFDLTDSIAGLRGACRAWLAGAASLCAIGIAALVLILAGVDSPAMAELQHRMGSLPLGPLVRFKLTFISANMLGAYLSPTFVLTLMAISVGWIGRWPGCILAVAIAIVTAMTFSAGIGGAMLGASLWFWCRCREQYPRRSKAVLALGIAAGGAFVLAQCLTPVPYPNPLFAIGIPGTEISLIPSSRLQVWIDTVRTIAANPWFGVGVGKDVASVFFTEPSGATMILGEGHSVLLNVAATIGIPGALAMAAIIWQVWARTAFSRPSGPVAAIASVGLAIGILDVLAFQGIGGAYEDARFVWVEIGLLLSALRLARDEDVACLPVEHQV